MTFDPFLESTLSSTQDEDHHSRGISKRLRSSSLSGKDKRESFPTHSRSLTDAFECDYHPLRSTFNDAEGVTRPRLDRILLGSFEIIGNEQEDEDGCQMVEVQPPTPHDETVVFIHEITPMDSLAGVALRYGISLAELRRANQLWASDSIHLRKSLYIPVDKTSGTVVKDLTEESNHMPQPTHDPLPSDTLMNGTSSRFSSIRRVPTSKLSFFPPPSNPSSLPLPDAMTMIPPPLPAQRPLSHYTPRPLSSFFSSLPIARLSFDSISNTTSTSDEQEHELSDVHHTHTTPTSQHHPANPWSVPTKTHYYEQRTSSSPPPTHSRVPSVGIGLIPLRKSDSVHSEPKPMPEWVHADDIESIQGQGEVRTVQMEPSPSMELPKTARSKGRPLGGDESDSGPDMH